MQFDFLIIGQGLAGTLIGYRLAKAGKSICYIDAPAQTAASSVAAGIINPITGRRFVKSWKIDALIPEATKLYAELEAYLGIKFHHKLPLVRTIFNRGDQNSWDVRSGETAYAPYMEDQPDVEQLKLVTEAAFNYVGVKQSSRVDLDLLTSRYRSLMQEQARLSPDIATSLVQKIVLESFDYDKLLIKDDQFRYGEIVAKNIIFCEGWRARYNPWFNYLPHRGAKGQVLHAKLEGHVPKMMFKHHVFLVPQNDEKHWIGATTENHFEDDAPTADARQQLEDKMKAVLNIPYTILDHKSAVRPTVKDRRPMLGSHPDQPNMFIFNGLGTKGASLAPLCSLWLATHIMDKTPIPNEVNINRFSK